MVFIRRHLVPIILCLLGLTLISVAAHEKLKSRQRVLFEQKRRKEIEQKVHETFQGCEKVVGFLERRECLKNKLVTGRAANPQVPNKYKIFINQNAIDLETEDLGDLIKIKRPFDLIMMNCRSNTFFFDWDQEFIYLSLENPLAGMSCRNKNNEFFIIPDNLSKNQIEVLKSSLNITIQ